MLSKGSSVKDRLRTCVYMSSPSRLAFTQLSSLLLFWGPHLSRKVYFADKPSRSHDSTSYCKLMK